MFCLQRGRLRARLWKRANLQIHVDHLVLLEAEVNLRALCQTLSSLAGLAALLHMLFKVLQGNVEVKRVGALCEANADEGMTTCNCKQSECLRLMKAGKRTLTVLNAQHKIARRVRHSLDHLGGILRVQGAVGKELA
jgi:hypothetical protein